MSTAALTQIFVKIETKKNSLTYLLNKLFLFSVILEGAAIEQGSSTPLMEAAQEGHVELVKFLLEQGTQRAL